MNSHQIKKDNSDSSNENYLETQNTTREDVNKSEQMLVKSVQDMSNIKPSADIQSDDIYVYSEWVNSLNSAKEFCKLNKIIPKGIVIIWEE